MVSNMIKQKIYSYFSTYQERNLAVNKAKADGFTVTEISHVYENGQIVFRFAVEIRSPSL